MYRMFYYCNNLTNVPLFDTPNVTNMSNMFYNCNNLSQASINNIVASCANATEVSNKRFKNMMGTMVYTNQTLKSYILSAPRYSAAEANGWTL